MKYANEWVHLVDGSIVSGGGGVMPNVRLALANPDPITLGCGRFPHCDSGRMVHVHPAGRERVVAGK